MIKFAAYLFSIYIVALSAMPCADSKSDCFDTATSMHQTTENHTHADICSPFCMCLCCGNQIVYAAVVPMAFAAINLSEEKHKAVFYKNRFLSNRYGSIWQPPKLSGLL